MSTNPVPSVITPHSQSKFFRSISTAPPTNARSSSNWSTNSLQKVEPANSPYSQTVVYPVAILNSSSNSPQAPRYLKKNEHLADQNLLLRKDLLTAVNRIQELEERLQASTNSSTALSNNLTTMGSSGTASTEKISQFFQDAMQKALLPHILSSQISRADMDKLQQENSELKEKLAETEKKLGLALQNKEYLSTRIVELTNCNKILEGEKQNLLQANTCLSEEKTKLFLRTNRLELQKTTLEQEKANLEQEKGDLLQENSHLLVEKTYLELEVTMTNQLNNHLIAEKFALEQQIQSIAKVMRKQRKVSKQLVKTIEAEVNAQLDLFTNGDHIIIPRNSSFLQQLGAYFIQQFDLGDKNDSAT